MRDRLLWIGCFAYAALFTWLGAIKYAAHRNLVDFGIFAQTAASAFGCFCNTVEGSHWAYHFSPILYLAGAAVALVHSPLALVALQAIAGALVAPPIYALALRAHGELSAARLGALVAWLYPPLAGLIFGDFHENGFAPAAVAWTLYAFEAGSVAGTLAGAVVTLAVKEDQAVFLAIAGALGAWKYRGEAAGRTAAAVFLLSASVFAAFFLLIQPHAAASVSTHWQPWRFYAWSPQDVRALLSTLPARLGFLVLAFGPLLFLPFRSPAILLAVAPLAEVLLSRMPTTYTMGTHYAGAWIGYVLIAFACALQRFSARRARILLGICAALCIVELAVADPLHPGLNLRRPDARDAALDRYLSTLPPAANVATQEEAYTHLALRDPQTQPLPELSAERLRACLILLDADFPGSARLQEYGPALERLARAGTYRLMDQRGAISLYRRTGC